MPIDYTDRAVDLTADLVGSDPAVTCCFSGHRPEKLAGNGDVKNCPELRRLLSVLRLAIEDALNEGYRTFITGMARGIDMWAAQFVLEIKRKRKDVRLVCAVPFRGQKDDLLGADLYDYNFIIDQADKVICLAEEYTPGCMKRRNCFMVDNSSKLIAVISDRRSGTGQTIAYARKRGLDLRIIDVEKNPALFKTNV